MKNNLLTLFICLFFIQSYAQVYDDDVVNDKDGLHWELAYDFMGADSSFQPRQGTCTNPDITNPMIFCPSNIIQEANASSCEVVVNFANPWIIDDCPGATVVCNPPSGSTFAIGITTITCTATDASNNTATCTFDMIVSEIEPPTINCPADIILNTTCPNNSAVATWADPIASDNCGILFVTCDPPSGSTFPIGTTTVSCVATDIIGNTTSCAFDVTVIDYCNCPPVIDLNNTIATGLYHAANTVSATNTTAASATVDFKAGNFIELQNGFAAPAATDFSAEIENCMTNLRSCLEHIPDEKCVEVVPCDTGVH